MTFPVRVLYVSKLLKLFSASPDTTGDRSLQVSEWQEETWIHPNRHAWVQDMYSTGTATMKERLSDAFPPHSQLLPPTALLYY